MTEIFHEKLEAGTDPVDALQETDREVIYQGGSPQHKTERLKGLASLAIEQKIDHLWLQIYREEGVDKAING
jgi:hypothetical protein